MGRFRAIPYAKALLDVVQKESPSRVEEIAEELDGVAATLKAVPDFQSVLVTPMVSVEAKTEILDAVLDSLEIGEPTRRFLHVVQHHYRMQHMTDIATEFRELVDQSLGRTRAHVETATELEEGSCRQLVDAISAFEGATVVADFEANRELLGGFKLQVGSRVFDGSLAGELDRLSKKIEIKQG
jgi:F-type H+-transporting ATPase subunit delta